MMKSLLLALIFALPFSVASDKPVSSKGKFTTTYDKFKDTTSMTMTVQLSKDWSDSRAPTMMVTHSYPGQQFKKPEKILISFYSDSKEWTFLDDWQRSFIILTDKKRINYGTMQRFGSDVRAGAVLELAGVWVVPQSFLEFATAKSAEIQLGKTVIRLKPEYLAAFYEFGQKVKLIE